MKKINLRGLQEKLSSNELKNVLGGSGGDDIPTDAFCYAYCCSDTGWYEIKCYFGFDSCIDEFGDNCPSGGGFRVCPD